MKRHKVSLLGIAMLMLIAVSCSNDNILPEPTPPLENEEIGNTKVKFEFTQHQQAFETFDGVGPDIFASTVTSVHLFVLDAESGHLVFEKTENTDNLIDGCIMAVDLDPGEYTFIAWCGLDANDESNAFKLKHNYKSRSGDNKLAIKMVSESEPVHDGKYESVYHGISRNVKLDNKNIDSVVTVPVIRDTNDINVYIHHFSETLDTDEYYVVYEDANGDINFNDNSIMSEDRRLEYKAYDTKVLQADTLYNGIKMEAGTMISHLSVSRLMANHAYDARIVIRNKNGTEVFAMPFISYAILLKESMQPGKYKDDQWYLDCEDTYDLSIYFTDNKQTWDAVRFIINKIAIVNAGWE